MAHCWAIILGIADEEKSNKILDFIGQSVNKNEIGLLGAVEPAYPLQLIDNGLRLIGFPDYFNNKTVFWPEVTILYAAALKKAGRTEEAEVIKQIIDRLIKKHETLYENYGDQGDPTKFEYLRFIGKPERLTKITTYEAPPDFAMALGTYLSIFLIR